MPEYSLSNASAGSFWYYRTPDQETGPLTAGRMRQLAKQGQLFPDDQVRLGTVGNWVRAEEVEGLFRGLPLMTRAEHAATRTQPADSDYEHAEDRAAPFTHFSDRLRGWVGDTVEWCRSNLEQLRIAVSWVCLVAVVVSLGLICGRRISIDSWLSGTDPYDVLRLAEEEFRGLRDGQADGDQWRQFVARTDTELEPLIARLEQQAGADDRYSQQLLWAARDVWPEMIATARHEPSDAERQFESYLANAEILKNGGQLYPGAERIGGAAGFNPDIFLGMYGDWVVAALIVADVFMAMAVARWWWHRRR